MVRNLLSSVVGGAGLIAVAVGLADWSKWPLIGLGALLMVVSVVGFLWDVLKKHVRPPVASPQIAARDQAVVSYQQSGGQTARTIVNQAPQRTFAAST